jgi:carbonic anhydrase
LGCIDSRAPPEIVFDVGLGEVFDSRTAGQVLDQAVIGSLQYATIKHVKLLVVLGHQNCGAVESTIASVKEGATFPGDIAFLVQQIEPAVKSVLNEPGDLLVNSAKANIELEIQQLENTQIISDAISSGELGIVGGYYSIETGIVDFGNIDIS